MKNKRVLLKRRWWSKIFLFVLFFIMVLAVFFPFYWIIISSLKDQNAIYAAPPQWFPHSPTIQNYIYSFTQSKALLYSINSLYLAGMTMALTVVISVMAVYPLTRMQFKGKSLFYGLLGSTQVFPVVITIVPMYIVYRGIGLYNTYASLIFTYTATSIPIAIVLLTGYFRDLPREIEEAATIDGCSRFKMLIRVIIPVSGPGIVATGIYVSLTIWQEYLIAVSLLSDQKKYTLTLGLTLFRTEHSTNWGALMATAVIIAAPAIILFFTIEKYFIDSLVGSVKE